MKVRVCYDDGRDYGDFEYFSKYNRINAKGIKEEIKREMLKRYKKIYKIECFYRIEED